MSKLAGRLLAKDGCAIGNCRSGSARSGKPHSREPAPAGSRSANRGGRWLPAPPTLAPSRTEPPDNRRPVPPRHSVSRAPLPRRRRCEWRNRSSTWPPVTPGRP
jgi:hypothetical protein